MKRQRWRKSVLTLIPLWLGLACSSGSDPSPPSEPPPPDPSPTGPACPEPAVLEPLNEYLQIMAVASGQVGAGEALEMTSFLLAPGVLGPPGFAWKGSTIDAACSAPQSEVFCPEQRPGLPGHCCNYECTGRGADWRMSCAPEVVPFESAGWHFEVLEVSTEWEEARAGVRFSSKVRASDPDGRDWSHAGHGEMIAGAHSENEDSGAPRDLAAELPEADARFDLALTFPKLFADGAAELTLTRTASETTGNVLVDGVLVAVANQEGELENVPGCR